MARYEKTDDVVYWQQQLQQLFRTAKDCGVTVGFTLINEDNNVRVTFSNDIGEKTGVSVR